MEQVIKGIKSKNKIIVGEGHLSSICTGIMTTTKGKGVGIMDFSTPRRNKRGRPSILALEFNDVAMVEYTIRCLKKLRKNMIKAGILNTVSEPMVLKVLRDLVMQQKADIDELARELIELSKLTEKPETKTKQEPEPVH